MKAGRACAARGTCSSPEPRIAACRPVGGRDHGTEAPAFPRRRVRTTTCDWSDPQAPHSCGERSRGCDRQRPAVRQSRDARRRRRWSRMSTSSELRFVMKSGATPAPTPRSRRCLRTRLTRDGQQALRRCRSHSPSGHQSEPADLFPDGRPTRADRARSGAAPICEGRSSASTEEQSSRRRGARALTFANGRWLTVVASAP
jgi:hypothetical protein